MYNILIVDDVPSFLQERMDFLVEKGCAVHCTTNARGAINMVRTNCYDCILPDVVLKEISGLLSLMASSPHTVFTSEKIFRHMWGNSPDYQKHIVQVTLSRLRNKLEKAFPYHHFIETVWGTGY